MALFDFLKNKKEADNAKTKKAVKKTVKASVAKKTDTVAKEKEEVKAIPILKSKKGKGFSYDIVKGPHISEKATVLGEKNKYTFKVYENSNKPEIKRSIEGIYGVNVLSVNIIKAPNKKRRIGRIEGYKKGFKKAVITVKEGQKIDII